MRRNKFFSIIFLLLMVMTVVTGCGQTSAGDKSSDTNSAEVSADVNEITIIDSLGETITVPYPLERVVILNSNAAEAVAILGAQDAVVGIADNTMDKTYLGLNDRPVVGKYSKPSYEKILELKPQAVLAYVKSYSDEDFSAKLEPLGIKVIKLDLFKPEAYDEEFRSLAKALGKEERAEAFLAWKKQQTDLLAKRLEGLEEEERVRVFAMYTSHFAEGNYKTFAQGTSTHQGIEMAGGINIAGEMEGYPQVNGEWVLEENPEIFVLNTSGDAEMGYDAQDITWSENVIANALADKVMGKTEAGQKGRVYLIYNRLLGGDKTYLGAFYLGKWFYPERFTGIQPDTILQEYFEEWLGAPLQGIWSYEAP